MRKIVLCSLLLSACATTAGHRPTQGGETQQQHRSPFPDFDKIAPRLGEEAADFDLRTPDGTRVRLTEAVRKGPVVLVFGSFS